VGLFQQLFNYINFLQTQSSIWKIPAYIHNHAAPINSTAPIYTLTASRNGSVTDRDTGAAAEPQKARLYKISRQQQARLSSILRTILARRTNIQSSTQYITISFTQQTNGRPYERMPAERLVLEKGLTTDEQRKPVTTQCLTRINENQI